MDVSFSKAAGAYQDRLKALGSDDNSGTDETGGVPRWCSHRVSAWNMGSEANENMR